MRRCALVYFGAGVVVWLSLLLGGYVRADAPAVQSAVASTKTLRIGTTFAPPFAIFQLPTFSAGDERDFPARCHAAGAVDGAVI